MLGVIRTIPRMSARRGCSLGRSSGLGCSQVRNYASESENKDKKINLKGFVTVGIFASIILTQVVDAVQKEKPMPRSMSESEYFRQQQRLKRKASRFTEEDKQVYFLKGQSAKDVKIPGINVVDPEALVEQEKNDESSMFHALLNDPGLNQVPRGLVIDLIGKYLGSQPNGKFLVLNFPSDVKESTQFEEKIVTIKNLIALKDQDVDDVVKYYNTVQKVKEINSVSDLNTILN